MSRPSARGVWRWAVLAALLAAGAKAQSRPALFHTPPAQVEAGAPFRVEGLLLNGKRITRVLLRVREPGQPFAELKMAGRHGDLYRVDIPAEVVVPPALEYFVEGVDKGGARVPLFMSAQGPVRVLVAGEAKPRAAAAPPAEEPKPKLEPPEDAKPAEQAAVKNPARPAEPEPRTAKAPPTRPPEDADDWAGEREPHPSPPKAAAVRAPEKPASPHGSELAEELAIYSAEDRSAAIGRHSEQGREAPITASTITQSEMRAMGARTVFDVLDTVPGISVSRDVAGFYRTAVRGLRSDPEVLFLLDGHPLNSFWDGRALANLPVENLARIEVIRGPGPASDGSGFLAVVNLVTDHSGGVRAAASGGATGSAGGHLSAASQLGGLRLFGDADVARSVGAARPIAQDSLGTERIDQRYRQNPSKPVGRTDDEQLLVNAGAGVAVGSKEHGLFTASARFLGEQRTALVGLFDTLGPDSKLSWRTALVDLTFEDELTSSVTLRAALRGDEQSTGRLYQLSPAAGTAWDGTPIPGYCTLNTTGTCDPAHLFPGGVLEDQRASGYGAAATLEADFSLGNANRLTLGVGANYRALYEAGVSINYDPGTLARLVNGTADRFQPVDSALGDSVRFALSRLSAGVYAHDVWTLFDPLTLTAGIRADVVQLPTYDSASGRFTGTGFVPSINPRVSLAYTPTPGFLLTLRYARAFRAPAVWELVPTVASSSLNGGRFTGNPALDSSVIDAVDLGGDLVQNAGDARVRLRGSAFYEYVTNPITQADISGNIIPIGNRLGERVFGADGEARLEITERARAWVNVSWFRAEDATARDPLKLLTDTPQWRVNLGITMPMGDLLNLDVLVLTGAERRNLARTPLEDLRQWSIPAFSLVDVQLRTEPLFHRFELALSVHNAFAQDYVDDAYRMDRMPGGVPRDGVAGELTVRAVF